MDPKLQHGFRLGECVVHPLQGLIERPEGSEHVQPKVMEVLLCLAERPGDVVERDELVDRVWGRTAVTDEVLTRCISELRAALGDAREHPRYVQTIPKRGYRLVASVETNGFAPEQSSPPAGETVAVAPAYPTFWQELKQRRVVRVSIAYAAVFWATLEIAELIIKVIAAPEIALKVVFILGILGFPVAVFLAWVVQITPEGLNIDFGRLRRTGAVDPQVGRRIDFVIIGALLIAIVILLMRMPDSGPVDGPDPNTIAVLRYLNIGGDPDNIYLSDGLTEELISGLAQLSELRVAARTSIWDLDPELDVPAIARRLRVRNVIEGSIRVDGGKIFVTAQLIGYEGFHLWTGSFERQRDDIFEIKNQIIRAVVDALEIELSPISLARIATEPAGNIKAYSYYLQGRTYLRRPREDAVLESALALFRRSLEEDPTYARAYAGLCETRLAQYEHSKNTKYVADAKTFCDRALDLDPALSEVHVSLGTLYRMTGDFDTAEREFRTALDSNSGLEDAYIGLAKTLTALNRPDESEATFKRAIELKPGFWGGYMALGGFYYQLGRYQDAADMFEQVTRLTPDNFRGRNNVAAALFMLENYQAAEREWKHSLDLSPTRTAYIGLGNMYYYSERYQDAVEMYVHAAELTPEDYFVWGDLAATYRQIPGQAAEEGASLDKAITLAQQQLEINPNDWLTLSYLASYHASKGNIEPARDHISRAADLAPDNPTVYFYSALVNVRLGNPDAAVADLKRAIWLGYSKQLIAAEPDFRAVSELPEFQNLVAADAVTEE